MILRILTKLSALLKLLNGCPVEQPGFKQVRLEQWSTRARMVRTRTVTVKLKRGRRWLRFSVKSEAISSLFSDLPCGIKINPFELLLFSSRLVLIFKRDFNINLSTLLH
jgi:hypothetical protein